MCDVRSLVPGWPERNAWVRPLCYPRGDGLPAQEWEEAQVGAGPDYFPRVWKFPGRGNQWEAHARWHGHSRRSCCGLWAASRFYQKGL